MHTITVDEKRGHEFEGGMGEVFGKAQSGEGRRKCIKIQSQKQTKINIRFLCNQEMLAVSFL